MYASQIDASFPSYILNFTESYICLQFTLSFTLLYSSFNIRCHIFLPTHNMLHADAVYIANCQLQIHTLIAISYQITLEKELMSKNEVPRGLMQTDIRWPMLCMIPDARNCHIHCNLKNQLIKRWNKFSLGVRFFWGDTDSDNPVDNSLSGVLVVLIDNLLDRTYSPLNELPGLCRTGPGP